MTVSDIIIISFYYIYANVCRDLSNKSNGMCIISHDIRVQRVNHNDLEIGQNLHKIIYYHMHPQVRKVNAPPSRAKREI